MRSSERYLEGEFPRGRSSTLEGHCCTAKHPVRFRGGLLPFFILIKIKVKIKTTPLRSVKIGRAHGIVAELVDAPVG